VNVHVDPHGELIAFGVAKVHLRSGDGAKPVRCRKCFLAESYRLVGRSRAGDFSSTTDLAWRVCVFLCRGTGAQSIAAKSETDSAAILAAGELSARHSRLREFRVVAHRHRGLSNFEGRFRYELEGTRFLEKLASAKNGIVLTAHMGSYDLAAALFSQKFHRVIRMVRAPESDPRSAEHVDLSLQQSSAGGVKVGYSNDDTTLAFDLLNALRTGEIISIQGDRVLRDLSRAPVNFFRREVSLPNGPFALSLVSETPIYPLFIVRTGYRKYKIVAREPITSFRADGSRDQVIAESMQRWAHVLEEILQKHWPQWFAFTPLD
jgi:lauroyl/myristoyl acyltransferase